MTLPSIWSCLLLHSELNGPCAVCLSPCQVGILPGGRQVVSAGDDGQLFLWDASAAHVIRAMKGSHASSISYLGTPRDSGSRAGAQARDLVGGGGRSGGGTQIRSYGSS
jgi:hypothetical protein